MWGRIGGLSRSDQTMQFNWKRTTILYLCVKEQTEVNANMMFVMNAMRNIQKLRRDQEMVFRVNISWSSHFIMSYVIYSYVLMSGGVLEITWEISSGQNVPWVVLSVRECLLWGNSEWECLVLRWGCFGWPINLAQKVLVMKRKCFCCNKGIIFWKSSMNSKF